MVSLMWHEVKDPQHGESFISSIKNTDIKLTDNLWLKLEKIRKEDKSDIILIKLSECPTYIYNWRYVDIPNYGSSTENVFNIRERLGDWASPGIRITHWIQCIPPPFILEFKEIN